MEATVVIDQIPAVPKEKIQKLENVLRKLFAQLGDVSFYFPFDQSSNKHKDFCFVTFKDSATADLAIKAAQNYQLDKNHTLLLNRFTDIQKYIDLNDYSDPHIQEYSQKEYLNQWLYDQRDQFVTITADQTTVYYNAKEPEKQHQRNKWTDSYVQWSPNGSYLATIHKQGVAIWGGNSWNKIHRFPHPNVKLIEFDKNEKYLSTYSIEPFQDGDKQHVRANCDVMTSLS
jgi:translation initiation factor 3 subunit B